MKSNFNSKVMKKIVNHFRQKNSPEFFSNTNCFSKYLIGTLFIVLFILAEITALGITIKSDSEVLKAFDLRITGKVDEAVNLLNDIIENDPENAVAHFELARTLNYMNLRGSAEADEHLKKAIQEDSENVIYAYYNAKSCFLKAYIAMQTGGDNVKDLIGDVCNEFVKVLEMQTNYPEALMYLVEIYGILPAEMGGDKIKAETYIQKLERMDKFYGAKARLVLLPDDTSSIEYWKQFISKNGESYLALKELGNAYIFNDNIDGAKECFEKAITIDKSQNVRLLDIARYHQMKVMQNRELAGTELPKSKEYIEKYLGSVPTPIPPLQAYALGMLAKIEMFSGNNDEAEKIMEKAKALDPYFSRAFGIPSLALFEPPNTLDHHFTSFFSPF